MKPDKMIEHKLARIFQEVRDPVARFWLLQQIQKPALNRAIYAIDRIQELIQEHIKESGKESGKVQLSDMGLVGYVKYCNKRMEIEYYNEIMEEYTITTCDSNPDLLKEIIWVTNKLRETAPISSKTLQECLGKLKFIQNSLQNLFAAIEDMPCPGYWR